jgi:hypothetical protein
MRADRAIIQFMRHNVGLTCCAIATLCALVSMNALCESPTSSHVNTDNLSMLLNLRVGSIAIFSLLTVYDVLEITNPAIDYSTFAMSFATHLPTAVHYIISYRVLYPNLTRFFAVRTAYWIPSTTCMILMLHGFGRQRGYSSKLIPMIRNALMANWAMFLTGYDFNINVSLFACLPATCLSVCLPPACLPACLHVISCAI